MGWWQGLHLGGRIVIRPPLTAHSRSSFFQRLAHAAMPCNTTSSSIGVISYSLHMIDRGPRPLRREQRVWTREQSCAHLARVG